MSNADTVEVPWELLRRLVEDAKMIWAERKRLGWEDVAKQGGEDIEAAVRLLENPRKKKTE